MALECLRNKIRTWRETRCWRRTVFFWELLRMEAGANLLNILQIKYWCLPRIHSAGDGAQQPENIKIMQMHLPKPHCFQSRWNIEILWKQQIILCMNLYCKCKGLTPGVTVLIPVAHGLPSPSIFPALLITGVFQEEEKKPAFLIIYIHVSSLLAAGTFGFLIWLLIQSGH